MHSLPWVAPSAQSSLQGGMVTPRGPSGSQRSSQPRLLISRHLGFMCQPSIPTEGYLQAIVPKKFTVGPANHASLGRPGNCLPERLSHLHLVKALVYGKSRLPTSYLPPQQYDWWLLRPYTQLHDILVQVALLPGASVSL